MPMKILAIETSCDETGVCVLEHTGGNTISILGNALSSQIEIHAKYGGVFPALAKRAHADKITILLSDALQEAGLLTEEPVHLSAEQQKSISLLDEKETDLKVHLLPFLSSYKKPEIDYIAVTVGPGLEPALWVGVNTAKVLSLVWDIPVIPINHMEGHVVTSTLEKTKDLSAVSAHAGQAGNEYVLPAFNLPAIALLVSGGHTELVLTEEFGIYKKIGQTRDDAVGEAFDKVARMLGLPYPGGPAVSKLAREFRETYPPAGGENPFTMPRPMMHSGDYDFSFSGIKTAMLYTIRDLTAQTGLTNQNTREIADEEKAALACAFEDAAIEVLIKKLLKATEEYNAQTIIVGGGVAGNTYLKSELIKLVEVKFPGTTVLFPEPWLATDNAVMIGMAAMTQIISGQIKASAPGELRADGNLSL